MVAYQGTPEWHAERRTMIGSSDAPMILGLSPFGGPFDVYQSKTDPTFEKVRSESELEQMDWGHRLEDTAARSWAERNGHRVRRAHKIIRHPHFKMLGASLDREVIGQPWIIEVKIKRFAGHGWGERGTSTIPHDIWVQVQHQLMVTGKAFAVVVVLFSGQELRWYNIERDLDFIEKWETAAVEWWNAHIVALTPPEVDGSPSARRWLDRLPADAEEEAIATPEIEALVGDLVQARRNKEQAAAHEELLKQKVQDFMGPASLLNGPGFKITWRRSKPAKSTAWQLIAKAYRRIIEEARQVRQYPTDAAHILDTDLDAIESIHTGENNPARPFLLTMEDEDA